MPGDMRALRAKPIMTVANPTTYRRLWVRA